MFSLNKVYCCYIYMVLEMTNRQTPILRYLPTFYMTYIKCVFKM